MTPFARLEKSAVINLARLGSTALRAFKGFKSAPSEFASALSGRGMPGIATELGRAGQLGNLAGHGMIGTGLFLGGNKAVNELMGERNSKNFYRPQKPNDGQRLGASHPDLKKRILEDRYVQREAASRGLSKDEAFAEFLKRYGSQGGTGQGGAMPEGMRFDAKPRDLNRMVGTGGMRPPSKSSKPFFNNPFTTEGRARIGTGLQNANESTSPLMKRDELRALYGEGPMAQFMAMTDPFRISKRMQYREGSQ